MGFVAGFGLVSLLGDATYEGARAVLGPYLASLGAGATAVGLITGGSEAAGYLLRLVSGPAADNRARRWWLTVCGYVVNVAVVPFLALTRGLWSATVVIVLERAGRSVKAPARDSMLADAGTVVGQGRAFAVHEAMDQTGALAGPLLVALLLALGAGYRSAFAALTLPAIGVVLALWWLRRRVPDSDVYLGETSEEELAPPPARGGPMSSRYRAYLGFAVATMAGYATFGVLSYHLAVHHVVSPAQVPLVYAAAMASAALAALIGGNLYEHLGLGALTSLPLLAAAVPFLSFSTSVALVWVGAVVWGAAMGIQESTMRAAVADMVPAASRGRAYGILGATYGLAWMGGGAAVGALYGLSVTSVRIYTVVLQVIAAVILLAFCRVGRGKSEDVSSPDRSPSPAH